MIEPMKITHPQRAKARAMGEILKYVGGRKNDADLANVVREIAARLRQELAAYRASLDEHGAPRK